VPCRAAPPADSATTTPAPEISRTGTALGATVEGSDLSSCTNAPARCAPSPLPPSLRRCVAACASDSRIGGGMHFSARTSSTRSERCPAGVVLAIRDPGGGTVAPPVALRTDQLSIVSGGPCRTLQRPQVRSFRGWRHARTGCRRLRCSARTSRGCSRPERTGSTMLQAMRPLLVVQWLPWPLYRAAHDGLGRQPIARPAATRFSGRSAPQADMRVHRWSQIADAPLCYVCAQVGRGPRGQPGQACLDRQDKVLAAQHVPARAARVARLHVNLPA